MSNLDSQRIWNIPVERLTLKGHTLELKEDELAVQAGRTGPAIQQLVWKLNQEMERILRMLPEAPIGYYWDFEHQRSEDLLRGVARFRIVAVLKETP